MHTRTHGKEKQMHCLQIVREILQHKMILSSVFLFLLSFFSFFFFFKRTLRYMRSMATFAVHNSSSSSRFVCECGFLLKPKHMFQLVEKNPWEHEVRECEGGETRDMQQKHQPHRQQNNKSTKKTRNDSIALPKQNHMGEHEVNKRSRSTLSPSLCVSVYITLPYSFFLVSTLFFFSFSASVKKRYSQTQKTLLSECLVVFISSCFCFFIAVASFSVLVSFFYEKRNELIF